MKRRGETLTTTVRLPKSIYDQAKSVVEARDRGPQSLSLNDLIVTALTAYLKMHQRREIDAAFAGMANDAEYQRRASILSHEFAESDWEALGLTEVIK